MRKKRIFLSKYCQNNFIKQVLLSNVFQYKDQIKKLRHSNRLFNNLYMYKTCLVKIVTIYEKFTLKTQNVVTRIQISKTKFLLPQLYENVCNLVKNKKNINKLCSGKNGNRQLSLKLYQNKKCKHCKDIRICLQRALRQVYF